MSRFDVQLLCLSQFYVQFYVSNERRLYCAHFCLEVMYLNFIFTQTQHTLHIHMYM